MAETAVDSPIVFEMTDALISKAVREDSIADLREYVKVRDLLIVAASTGVFFLALRNPQSHWLWWLAGLPAVILVVLFLGWLAIYLLKPKQACSRLAHLPHRMVTVHLGETGIAFQTATERLEVAWSELKRVRRLRDFWIVGLRAGTRIPLPVTALSDEAKLLLEAKLRSIDIS